jgi:hypothetical protein
MVRQTAVLSRPREPRFGAEWQAFAVLALLDDQSDKGSVHVTMVFNFLMS